MAWARRSVEGAGGGDTGATGTTGAIGATGAAVGVAAARVPVTDVPACEGARLSATEGRFDIAADAVGRVAGVTDG